MKGERIMSDDLVPEEGEPEYSQLLAVLRPSPHKRVPIAASEQAQIIARVRERLELAVPASALPDTGTLTPQLHLRPTAYQRGRREPPRSSLPIWWPRLW